MATSTWEGRDFPVLQAVVEICDHDAWGSVEPAQIAQRLDMELEDVNRALWKLAHERPALFSFTDDSTFGGRDISVSNPTGHAQRLVGAWPTPESLIDRLVAALQQAADDADSPEEKTKLRRAADALGGVGKGVVTGVLTHVLTQGF